MTKAAAPAPHGCQGTPAAMRRRTRALDAFIDLVLKGHLPPTVEQVAGRAGISKATFFRYFESLGAMRYDAVARMVDLVRRRMAGQIREHFAPELRERSQARRDDLVALIAMLTSVESWDQFRNVYGRSPLQTRRTWTHAIDALLRRTAP